MWNRNLPRSQWFRFRLRTLLALVAVVAALMAGARLLRSLTADVETDAWVGWSEAELVAWMGQPGESQNEDFHAFPEPTPPIGPRRTLYFRTRWGHLWIWLRLVDHRWVCYRSCWYRDGSIVY